MKSLRLSLLPAASCLALCFPLLQAQESQRAKLTEVVREVNYRSGSDLESMIAAAVGLEVHGRDVLTTGARSRAELLFDNDVLTRLGSNSIFSFAPDQRILELEQGLALIRVPKGSREPVQMRTPAATAAITGTTVLFSVQPSPGDGLSILKLAVLEGSLRITYPDGDVLDLHAGQMIISSEGDPSPPQPVDIDLERLSRTSGLVHDFEGELGSEALIEGAASRQERAKRAGILSPTRLLIHGAGTDLDLDNERDDLDPDLFNSLGALESNRDRILDGDLSDPVIPSDPLSGSFAGDMSLRETGGEFPEYLFSAGGETFRSSRLNLERGSVQAIPPFETISLTGNLEVESLAPDPFFFVASGSVTSPALTVNGLHVRSSIEPSLVLEDVPVVTSVFSEPQLGFVALRNGLDIRGTNTVLDLGGVLFAALEGNLRTSGSLRLADQAGETVRRGSSAFLSADNGDLLASGTIDASGEGETGAARGGTISLVARDNVTLASGSRVDASLSDSADLIFSPSDSGDFGGTVQVVSREGRLNLAGSLAARGGTTNEYAEIESIFISGASGITQSSSAAIDASAHQSSDPYAPRYGSSVVYFAGGDSDISGSITARGNLLADSGHAGAISFFQTSSEPESHLEFRNATIDATGGAGGLFDAVSSPTAGGTSNLSMISTAVDVSGTSTAISDRSSFINIDSDNLVIDESALNANTLATAVESTGPVAAITVAGGPRINLVARDRLVIRNSSDLSALVNGGEAGGGMIELSNANGPIEIASNSNLEAGSIAAASRSLSIVDGNLHAHQGDIRLIAEESIELLRAVLQARTEIYLNAPIVNVNDSTLRAPFIDIYRESGNVLMEAGNTFDGRLTVLPR